MSDHEEVAERFRARNGLDFAPPSLGALPTPDPAAGEELVWEAGCFYGEVVRRALGGRWSAPAEPFVSMDERGRIVTGAPAALGIELPGGILLDVFETAARWASGDARAFGDELEELEFELTRGPAEVFDDASYHYDEHLDRIESEPLAPYVPGSLVLAWLASRDLLVPRWAEQHRAQQGRRAAVFEALGGRITSYALRPDADRFMRLYWLGTGAELGDTLWTHLEAVRSDDDRSFSELAAVLDARWEAWVALGRP